MAKQSRQISLDAPRGRGGMLQRSAPQPSRDRFGRFSESFARATHSVKRPKRSRDVDRWREVPRPRGASS